MQNWGVLEWVLAALGGLATVMMWGTQVGPKQAISHTAEWAVALGFRNPPQWLVSTEADRVVRHVAALILLVSVFLILIQAVDVGAMHPVPKAIFGLAAIGIAAGIVLNLTQPTWIGALRNPSFFIVVGLVVALVAVVWQWRRSAIDPTAADLRTQVALQAKEIEALKKQNVTSGLSPSPATSNAPSPGATPLVTPPLDAPREFTGRSPRQLLALYDGRTPFQADKLIDAYKGLWIETESKVLNILPDGPGRSIVVLRDDKDTIECRFGPNWSNAVARLDAGDALRVRGKISPNQNGQQLYLLECEIVQAVRGSAEPDVPPEKTGVFEWNFDGLLGGSSWGQGPNIAKIWIVGVNRSNSVLPIHRAKIISLVTGNSKDMKIKTNKGYVAPDQANPIVPGATIYLHTLFYDPHAKKPVVGEESPLSRSLRRSEGITATQFLQEWGSFRFEIEFTHNLSQASWNKVFEYAEIKSRVDAMNARPSPTPMVTKRDS